MRNARSFLGLLALVSACGGVSGTPPKTTENKASEDGSNLTADFVRDHGGIASLGGSGDGSTSGGGGYVPDGLRADLVEKDKPVKLDGLLTEWPVRTTAKQVIKGSAGVRAMTVAMQYDDTKIYIGAEITDDKLARTDRFGDAEDHASLILAFPVAGGYATHEVGLYAGKPGESAGSVRFSVGPRKGQEIQGAKIVEAPIANGYAFEASIPWSALPESQRVKVGLRGAVRYYDADTPGTVSTILATGAGDATTPTSLPMLPTESELSLMDQLLVPKGLVHTSPKFDAIADVAGDGTKERVSVYDRYLVICGSSYLGGTRFYFKDLGGEFVRLELHDVTGRGKEDLLLRRRFPGQGATREWFEVLSVMGDNEPQTTFAHEVSVVSGPRKVINDVHVSMREIEVTVEPAVGWDAGSYREAVAADVEPVLLPWGAVRSRSFKFEGGKFKRGKEVAQAVVSGPSSPDAAPQTPARPVAPPTPQLKPAGDLSRQVLAQFKRDRNVTGDDKPRFDLEVQVAEDARPERVALVGRDIVVFGPGFRGGNSYAYITLQQFADASDIHEITARDLTGDGNADIVVRGVRHTTPTGSSEAVDQDVLFVYEVRSAGISRVFGIETGREQSGKRVQGMVQFIPGKGGKSFEVDVRPGRATGWTEKSYPWPQDQPGGSVEPLLLPWGGIASLRYAWNGTAFVKQ